MYSKEMIETLLIASDFLNSPRELVSAGQNPHRYYYPYQAVTTDTFFQDQWDYVVAQKDKIRNRCVIFLVKSGASPFAAVILYLSDIDEDARNELLRLFSDGVEKNSPQELSNKERLALFGLYRRIQCSLVGSVPEMSSHNAWKSDLQTVYTKAVCQINKQPIYADQQSGMVFAESLLRLGQQKPIGTMDAQQILRQHHQLCCTLLRHWWLDIQQNQPTIFTQLETLTCKLLKYVMLQTLRQSHAVDMSTASYEQLNSVFLQDQMQKSTIYSAPIPNIFLPLDQLSFSTVVGLLAYRQPINLPGLIQLLQDACQKEQVQIKEWESDLSELLYYSRCFRPTDMAYFAAEQVYQYSFIGVGAELTPILASWGLEAFGQTEKFTPAQQYRLFTGLKWLGGGLGAAYTICAGSYSFAKLVLIGNTSYLFDYLIQTSRLDDHTATVRESFPLGKIGLSRSLRLGIAGLESLVYRRPHYLTAALGGILGSIGSVGLGTRWLVPDALSLQSPETSVLLLFCSLFGYEIGDLLVSTLHQRVDKLLTREALSEAFCQFAQERNYQGCKADFSVPSAWSPSFWMRGQDSSVRLSWYNAREFQETDCFIVPLRNGNHSVMCDLPEVVAVRRLG